MNYSTQLSQAGDIYYRVTCDSFKNRESEEARNRELAIKVFGDIFCRGLKVNRIN